MNRFIEPEINVPSTEVSSTYGYIMVVTNQSAAKLLSTNQNHAFRPCDFYDVKLTLLPHVTP